MCLGWPSKHFVDFLWVFSHVWDVLSFKLTLAGMSRAVWFCFPIPHHSAGYSRRALMAMEEKTEGMHNCGIIFKSLCFLFADIPKEGIWLNSESEQKILKKSWQKSGLRGKSMFVIYHRVPWEKLHPHPQLCNPEVKKRQSNFSAVIKHYSLRVFGSFLFIFVFIKLCKFAVTENPQNLSCRCGRIQSSNSGV